MRCTTIALALAALAPPAAAQRSNELEEPVRLRAGDKLIDTGEHIAHAGPLFADLDGDGLRDLLVGNFRGHVQVYENAGTATEPKLVDAGLLERDGRPIKIPNW